MPTQQQERREERREEHREEHREDREHREEHREERRDERRESRLDRRDDRHEDRGIPMVDLPNTPVFHPGRPTKILYSPGTGAGWISFAPKRSTNEFLVWMLTYEPLIKALERRERKERLEEILRDFHHQAHTDYNVERIMCARAGDLAIWEVRTPFEVRDNDGAERVVEVMNEVHRRIVPMGACVY